MNFCTSILHKMQNFCYGQLQPPKRIILPCFILNRTHQNTRGLGARPAWFCLGWQGAEWEQGWQDVLRVSEELCDHRNPSWPTDHSHTQPQGDSGDGFLSSPVLVLCRKCLPWTKTFTRFCLLSAWINGVCPCLSLLEGCTDLSWSRRIIDSFLKRFRL